MPQKLKVSIAEKTKMVRMYLTGKISMNRLAQLLEVNWSTAAEWVRNYEAEGANAFLPNKSHTHSQEVKRQAVEEYQRSNARPASSEVRKKGSCNKRS